jgi:hypothetical protein
MVREASMGSKKKSPISEYNPLPFFLRVTKELSFDRATSISPWPELYHEVWIENESRWGDSAKRRLFNLPAYDKLWDMFAEAAEITTRYLVSTHWEKISPNDLVHLYEAFLTVQTGIFFLVPPEITDPEKQKLLFYDTLIRKAILDHIQGFPLTPKYALVAYTTYTVGPAVVAELNRRGSFHKGTLAAILKMCFALMKDNKAGFDFDDSWNASQKEIVRLVSGNLYRILGKYPDWKRRDVREEIIGRVFETLGSEPEYAGMDPLQALRAALEEKLNIFPRRVADRIRNSLRSTSIDWGYDDKKYRELRQKKREEPRDLAGIIEFVDENLFVDKNSTYDFEEAEVRIDIDKFLKKHPEHRDAYNALKEARSSEKGYKTLADESGIVDRTLRLRIQKMMEDLRRFWSTE